MNEYRIRSGTYSEADLTTAYAVHQFPVQSDQGGLRWFQPVDPSQAVSDAAELVTALDGSRGGFGGFEFSWVFGALTTGMVKYLRDTFFDGTGYSADVTVRTFDRAYGWRVLNCKALWNDPAKEAETLPGMSGYSQLRMDFINGVIADSETYEFSTEFSTEFNA